MRGNTVFCWVIRYFWAKKDQKDVNGETKLAWMLNKNKDRGTVLEVDRWIAFITQLIKQRIQQSCWQKAFIKIAVYSYLASF